VEHHNAIVVGAARSLLKARAMPDRFWGEVELTAVYLLNRSSTKSVSGATPYEVWFGGKPSIHHLRVFGCVVYVRNTKPHLSKLEVCGHRMVFIGYDQGTKGYRVHDHVKKQVHISRDVVFDKSAQWDWTKEEGADAGGSGEFSVEYMVLSTRSRAVEAEEVEQLMSPPKGGLGSPPHSDVEDNEEPRGEASRLLRCRS
jgi:hypothetical protein